MKAKSVWLAALCGVGVIASAGVAETIYDEATDGDLSDDIEEPTYLGTLGLGTGSVSLEFGNSTAPDGDFDVFGFTIAPGQEWSGLIVEEYVPGDEVSYLAIDDSDTFPVDPNLGDPSAFLAGALWGTADVGEDIFPQLRIPEAGGVGFDGNLGPGDYSIFVQQTGPITRATLGFEVTPAPSSAALLGLAGVTAARRRRR